MGLDLTNSVDDAEIEDAGRRITLLKNDGEPYTDPETDAPVTALIAGTYSKRFKAAQRKLAAKQKKRFGKPTAEQEEEDNHELFASCVIEWDLIRGSTMAPPAWVFGKKPGIYSQVVNAAAEHADFFAGSSTP